MSHSIVSLVILIAVSLLLAGNASALLYGNNMDISTVDHGWGGENKNDNLGDGVAMVGDVNGDGFSDMIVAARYNDDGGNGAGKVYLILGRDTSGWPALDYISNVDASFIGVGVGDNTGRSVDGAGDVNGDGLDDILVGAYMNDAIGNNCGQAFLIFGRRSGWSQDMNLFGVANASFIGENTDDMAGQGVAGVGDVNGDGYDDIMVGALGNDEPGLANGNAGQAYLILGKPSGWQMNTSLRNSDASFWGENNGDHFGNSLSGAGDVNGDGLDDIIVGASDASGGTGIVYLVLGKRSGWNMDTPMNTSDSSWIGENANDLAGDGLAGGGDINGDGYDDMLIGAPGYDVGGGNEGKVYIIAGRDTGWGYHVSLSASSGSFLGENNADNCGGAVSFAGDVDGDGCDDILIGAYSYDFGGVNVGKAYLVLGNTSGPMVNMSVSGSSASFIGESTNDYCALALDGGGDVDRDGLDDILVGATQKDYMLGDEGKVYLIFPDHNAPPIPTGLEVLPYRNAGYNITTAYPLDTVYVKLTGTDANASRPSIALVNVSVKEAGAEHFTMRLRETGDSTGVFEGWLTLGNITRDRFDTIHAVPDTNISLSVVSAPGLTWTLRVLYPLPILTAVDENLTALEDEAYTLSLNATGGKPLLRWSASTDAGWLTWNPLLHNFSGTPTNADVGNWSVSVSINDSLGLTDQYDRVITVVNTIPRILQGSIPNATEDLYYTCDLTSTDEGQGLTSWILDAGDWNWLSINTTTGVLSGTPSQADVGECNITVFFDDGNGGGYQISYWLWVIGVNDPPVISGSDVISATEDIAYVCHYSIMDPDGDTLVWGIDTNATWLSKDNDTPGMQGTPTNDDVGSYYVNFIVTDGHNGSASRLFTLTVVNVNDPPVWLDLPASSTIPVNFSYSFDVNASDVDVGDSVTFSISSSPSSNITIDPFTGIIRFSPAFPDTYAINISATDGNVTIYHDIIIDVFREVIDLPPYFTTTPVMSAAVGVMWAYTPIALDPEGDMVTVSLITMPTGMEFDGPVLNWVPAVDQTGMHDVVIRATVNGLYTDQSFTLEVTRGTSGNHPPDVEEVGNMSISAGQELSVRIVASDPDGDNISYGLTGPDGMIIDGNGSITWWPGTGDVGQYNVTVVVSDGIDRTTVSFSVSVTAFQDGTISDDGPVEPVGNPFIVAIVIAIILIILVMIAGVVFVLLRKSKRKDDEDVPGVAQENASTLIPEVEERDIFKEKDIASVSPSASRGGATVDGRGSDEPVEVELVPSDVEVPVLEREPDGDADVISTGDAGVLDPTGGSESLSGGSLEGEERLERSASSATLALPPATIMGTENADEDIGSNIDEVLIMSTDGILLDHYARTSSSEIDRDILSGMLTAVQGFVKDSFTDRDASLRRLEMRDFTVLIEPGKYITAVAITAEKDDRELNDHLLRMMRDIDSEMASMFENWDGNMDSIRQVDGYIQKLLEGGYE